MTTITTLNKWFLRGGSHIGSDHRKAGGNKQDAFATETLPGFMIGVVADGCGSGEHSETGALRSSSFIAIHAANLFKTQNRANDFDVEKFLSSLYREYIIFLQDQVNAQFRGIDQGVYNDQVIKFANDHLLHTIVIMMVVWNGVSNSWDAYVVWKGDGYYVVDLNVVDLDAYKKQSSLEKNIENVIYPALALQCFSNVYSTPTGQQIQDIARSGFNFVKLGKWGKDWNKIAIASDGLRFVDQAMLEDLIYPSDLSSDMLQQNIIWAIKDMELISPDDITAISLMPELINVDVNEGGEMTENEPGISENTMTGGE